MASALNLIPALTFHFAPTSTDVFHFQATSPASSNPLAMSPEYYNGYSNGRIVRRAVRRQPNQPNYMQPTLASTMKDVRIAGDKPVDWMGTLRTYEPAPMPPPVRKSRFSKAWSVAETLQRLQNYMASIQASGEQPDDAADLEKTLEIDSEHSEPAEAMKLETGGASAPDEEPTTEVRKEVKRKRGLSVQASFAMLATSSKWKRPTRPSPGEE